MIKFHLPQMFFRPGTGSFTPMGAHSSYDPDRRNTIVSPVADSTRNMAFELDGSDRRPREEIKQKAMPKVIPTAPEEPPSHYDPSVPGIQRYS